ncbi:HET-domain-containing protein [Xylariaceae sp. FL1651]|nr:HET-domain-containing protein [Xylariaceae sp. FL1651]
MLQTPTKAKSRDSITPVGGYAFRDEQQEVVIMLCSVCREGLNGVWDPERATRLGKLIDFPEILRRQLGDTVDVEDYPEELTKLNLQEHEQYVFGHHTSYDSLARSKQQGCVACKEFAECNDAEDANIIFEKLGYYSVFCAAFSRSDYTVYNGPIWLVYSGEPIEEFWHDLVPHDSMFPIIKYVAVSVTRSTEHDFVNSAISFSTSSAETWAMAQAWLKTCLGSHTICRDQRLDGFIPSRLLELSANGSEHLFRLVLRQEVEADPQMPYVTLSHCWGSAPPQEKLRLTRSTELLLRGGYLVSELPKTFRDAFAILERLGVRYLWIDKLCIFQDSAEDWRNEASAMQSIYRHGYLNIAALGSPNDEGGCFFERDPLLVGPSIININPEGEMPSYFRHTDEPLSWENSFNGEPLITRAWVLQERLLSVRILYFGKQQVFWECCSTTCCETLPQGPLSSYTTSERPAIPVTVGLKAQSYAWKPLTEFPSSGKRQDEDAHWFRWDWDRAVKAYSACSLTFPGDKLVALSGLATEMHRKQKLAGLHDAYLAGLWKSSMPDSLMWNASRPGDRPAQYRAPSWSWASIDGVIIISAGLRDGCLVVLVSAEMQYPTENSFGEIIRGALVLKGPVCAAKVIRLSRSGKLDNGYLIGGFHNPDTGREIDFDYDIAYVYFDAASQDQYVELTLLFFWSRDYPQPRRNTITGLALLMMDKGVYRRIGHFSINIYPVDEYVRPGELLLEACSEKTVEVI